MITITNNNLRVSVLQEQNPIQVSVPSAFDVSATALDAANRAELSAGYYRPLESFGAITGTVLATDVATWNAALTWAKANRGTIIAPPNKSSLIGNLNLVSFARVLAFGHTFRVGASVGFTQPTGQQLVDFELHGAYVIPHSTSFLTAQVFNMRVIQRCIMRLKVDGFVGGRIFQVRTQNLTSWDLVDASFLIGSNNSIYNDIEIYARGCANVFDIAGHYGTVPTASPPNSSPAPLGVCTKNRWVTYSWAVTSECSISRRCCDGDYFLVDTQLAANGAIAFRTGDGAADTYIGNNYSNNHKVELVAATAAGVTSCTLVYADSWSYGMEFDVYHDINFTVVTVTEIGKNAGIVDDDFDWEWNGSGVDTTLFNTSVFERSENKFYQVGAGSSARPTYSFNRERGTGMYLDNVNRIGFAVNEVRRLFINTQGVGILDGTTALPGLFFMGLSTTGIYRTGTGLGISTSGVARFAVADTFVNTSVPLYVNSSQVVSTTGKLYFGQGNITTKSAAATLTGAEVLTGLLQYTGAAANITLPTGTNLNSGLTNLVVDRAVYFSIVNTGTGAVTLVTNTDVTIVGSTSIPNGTSATYLIRKTGTLTYTVYRVT